MFALVNTQTIGHETPLMKAAASCNVEAVDKLFYWSEAPFAENQLGKNVLSFARSRAVKALLLMYQM